MEVAVSPQVQKQNLHTPGRKILLSGSQKDLWIVVRERSLTDVESALALLKKRGGNINLRNAIGLTPLHIATWRNHIPIVRRLLAAGADPNARDGESGWSSLHRALHFGHLAVASILLQHGASTTLEDSKSRIPIDLLSGPVFQVFENQRYSAAVITTRQVTSGLSSRRVERQLLQLSTIQLLLLKVGKCLPGDPIEVYTWGHRLVTPTRVVITRNLKKSGSTPLKFHRMERLHVVSIAAGMVHSMALTDDGALFYWVSSDPDLRCHQLYAMCGRNMVSISAGKYWTAAATATGDIYMWDGKKSKDKPPVATRLHGVKRATSVSVGETHLLIVASLYHPVYPPNVIENSQKLKLNNRDDMKEINEDILFEDMESNNIISGVQNYTFRQRSVPSLKSLCEKVAAECLVEPRNAIQLLEIADSLGADDLKKYCEEIVMRNLDYIFTISSHAVSSASPDVLANLEKSLDQKSSEPWSHRGLPTPTASFPVIINSEEDDGEMEFQRTCDKLMLH